MTKLVTRVPETAKTAPNAATDWPFPFPAPGRRRAGAEPEVPVLPAYRWPYRPLADEPIPPRGVRAPVSLEELKRVIAGWSLIYKPPQPTPIKTGPAPTLPATPVQSSTSTSAKAPATAARKA